MIVGKPLHVMVECIQAGGRHDADLPHRATQHAALANRTLDKVRRAGEQRSAWRAQPFGKGDGDEIERRGEFAHAPSTRDCGVPESRAVEERRKIGKIFVLGPFSPGQGQKLLMSNAISGGYMWNPKQAGEVFVTLADRLMKGGELKDGEDERT